MLNATEFYIRKVDDIHNSNLLLDVLDSLRAGESLEESLPRLTS